MQKNTYKFRKSLADQVIERLKKCSFDSKSMLIGAAMAAIASSTVPGVFASFGETEVYKVAAKDIDLTNAITTGSFVGARYGLLEPGFDAWGLADESGWSVAHEAALFGNLPEDFPHMEMADKKGVTVADALAEGKRNAKLYFEVMHDAPTTESARAPIFKPKL
jgi:hypothetical protein